MDTVIKVNIGKVTVNFIILKWSVKFLLVPFLFFFLNSVPLVAQVVKNPPATQETWVRSLGWEDFLEEGMATLSSILAWTEEPGGSPSPWGHEESDTTH